MSTSALSVLEPKYFETPAQGVHRELLAALTSKRRDPAGPEGSSVPIFTLSKAERKNALKVVRRYKQNVTNLRSASKKKTKKAFATARNRWLTQYPTRFCAAVRSLAKSRQVGVSFADIGKLAALVDVRKALDEKVTVIIHPKPGGGYRPFARYGLQRMAQQFVVRDLLRIIDIDNPYDFSRYGAGGEVGLFKELSRRVVEEGHVHWRTADLRAYYPSLRQAHFNWLDVPADIIRNVVFLPKCAKIGVSMSAGFHKAKALMAKADTAAPGGESSSSGSFIGQIIKEVRRGLPQGAVLSPVVARALVGRELRQIAEAHKVDVISYVDDIALSACSASQVAEAMDALRERLKSHPAGPIFLHHCRSANLRIGKRLYVLKYAFTLGDGYGRPYHIRPTASRFIKPMRRARQLVIAAGEGADVEAIAAEVTKRWFGTQLAWTKVPHHSEDLAFTSICLAADGIPP